MRLSHNEVAYKLAKVLVGWKRRNASFEFRAASYSGQTCSILHLGSPAAEAERDFLNTPPASDCHNTGHKASTSCVFQLERLAASPDSSCVALSTRSEDSTEEKD